MKNRMNIRFLKHFIVGVFLFSFVNKVNAQSLYECPVGNITFTSNADLEIITASSDKLKGLLDLEKNTFAFNIDVTTFQGFNSDLQKEHFNENYLESNLFPKASFSGKIIDKIDPAKATQTIRAKGKMNIHGIQQERIINVDLVKKGDSFTFTSTFNVMLADHGITIPRIVYQKISETIKLNVSGNLKMKK